MLYWVDLSDTSPGIYRSSVINPAREKVVSGSTNVHMPNGLAVDFTGKQITECRLSKLTTIALGVGYATRKLCILQNVAVKKPVWANC